MMVLFVQTAGAMLAVVLVALINPGFKWPIYAGAAFLGGWGSTWLYLRWKHGKGVTVHPSRKID
jgi:hypothetical protein